MSTDVLQGLPGGPPPAPPTSLAKDEPVNGHAGRAAAPTSPLARLRASYAARQDADPERYVNVWEDGDLVAKIARTEDLTSARAVMRAMSALLSPLAAERMDATPDELADIIATATTSLHQRGDTGELEPIVTEAGMPLRFDGYYGQAIGVPDITTPRGAVFSAFTRPAVEGGPPVLDTLQLLKVATEVCTALASSQAAAREAVGKVSLPSSFTTPG